MISLLNLGENEQDLSITFFSDGEGYKLPVHLKAGGSTMFNVSDIIMMQQADPDGNKIPSGVTHGIAVLSGSLGYPEWINVGISVGIFNVSTATCGTTCPSCFGYSAFQVLPYNSTTSFAPVGGTATFVAWAFGEDNLWHVVSTLNNSVENVAWDSDNHNVAASQGASPSFRTERLVRMAVPGARSPESW